MKTPCAASHTRSMFLCFTQHSHHRTWFHLRSRLCTIGFVKMYSNKDDSVLVLDLIILCKGYTRRRQTNCKLVGDQGFGFHLGSIRFQVGFALRAVLQQTKRRQDLGKNRHHKVFRLSLGSHKGSNNLGNGRIQNAVIQPVQFFENGRIEAVSKNKE